MNRQNGYSLLGLVTTIVFVGIAFAGLFAFFANTVDNSARLDIANQAAVLAQEQMETIIADKHSPSRGLQYVLGENRYPVQNIGAFERRVIITAETVDDVDGFTVTVKIKHEMLPDYDLTVFLTEY